MNFLKLRDLWGYFEASKNGWIRMLQNFKKLKLHTKLVPETVHQMKPSYFLWSTGKTAKKTKNKNNNIGSIDRQTKNNIIWFLGSVFFKKNLLANTEEKR